MGSELLLTALIHDESTRLDWAAGREVIRKMPKDAILRGVDEAYGDSDCTVTEARRQVNRLLTDLKREVASPDKARDGYVWKIRGALVHIRGGDTWGDDPTGGWTTFTNAWYFPGVLKAVGFEVGE